MKKTLDKVSLQIPEKLARLIVATFAVPVIMSDIYFAFLIPIPFYMVVSVSADYCIFKKVWQKIVSLFEIRQRNWESLRLSSKYK